MLGLVGWTVVVALASAFALMLANKWRIIEWMQVHTNGVLHDLVSCHFCTTFWACVIIVAVAVPLTGYLPALVCPILATPIAVRLW